MSESIGTVAERRREILDEALQLVQSGGLASLTMKKVADRVGFTETAAYRYFPNKQALLLGLAERLGEMLLEPVRRLAASGRSPGDRIRAILEHHIDFVLKLDGLPILVLVEAAAIGEEKVVAQLAHVVDEYLTLVGGVVAETPTGSRSVRPGELALLLMGIPATLAIKRRLGADPEAEERVRTELIPFVLHCLTGEGAEGGQAS